MEKARLRALTQYVYKIIYTKMRRRNGKSPTKGIDTCIFAIDNIDAEP